MRKELGVANPAYNLARNWAHWGHNAGGPRDGAVVVWAHHVGRIVGSCSHGEWLVHSGNDGGRIRTRCRSVRGAIAFRDRGFAEGYGEHETYGAHTPQLTLHGMRHFAYYDEFPRYRADGALEKPFRTRVIKRRRYARHYHGGRSDGVASVYRGGRTASGQWASPSGFTAASPTLPFGSRVRVTNTSNGRSVTVRIDDRGPFVRGRIIDLTPAAAHAIGFAGLAHVRVTPLL
jgi:rare lipoprotein A